MIGYKIGQITLGDTQIRVLITLEIPNDAQTNLNRTDIKDKKYAKYRCNKALVISIEDNKGNKHENAFSSIYNEKSIEYKVGEKVEEPNYDKDIDIVCGEGIHFFLNKEIALLYGLDKVENGEYKEWHDNGQLYVQYHYIKDKIYGEYKEWCENGQLSHQTQYIEGKIHGEYKAWFDNSQLRIQTNYVKGKTYGEYKEWCENGQLNHQTQYIEGKIHGEYKV